MKISNSFGTCILAILVWALALIAISIIATGLQYDSSYKVKTLREVQQQQDRMEQKLDLILEK